MAEKDLTEKLLEDYADVFADIFNALVFKNDVVSPNDLTESFNKSIYKADNRYHELERDVVKEWLQGDVFLAILGLENQTYPDKSMPFRIAGYDGVSYRTQVSKHDSKIRELRDKLKNNEITQEEYTIEYNKIEKNFAPVVTIVLYFGTEQHWQEPLKISDVVGNKLSEKLLPLFNDIKINVFEIAWLTDEQISLMKSDFKQVALFFRDKRLGKDDWQNDKSTIKHVDEFLKLLSAITNDKSYEEIMTLPDYKEVNNMCSVATKLSQTGELHIINLWNWLNDNGRKEEADKIMNPQNYELREKLYSEYEKNKK